MKKPKSNHIAYSVTMVVLSALVVLMQNCQSEMGGNAIKANSSLSPGQLGMAFANSVQNVPTGQATLMLDGICETGNFPGTRIDWQFNIGSVINGRLEPACVGGRFFLNIPLSSYNLTGINSFVVYGTIFGVDKNGRQVEGPAQSRSQVTVNFTTGGTGTGTGSGSGTGGTGGPTNACLTNPALATLCNSIRVPGDFSNVVNDLNNEQPNLIRDCERRQSANPNWNAFTKELVRRLRAQTGDNRWGFNYVRGVVGDVNGDTIAYCGGNGCAAEQSPAAVVIDVVVSCGAGGSNTPAWAVIEGHVDGCCTGQTKWTQTPLQ
jgi:hypothetical protein